jgi:uncharacterized protein (DUF2147 family)
MMQAMRAAIATAGLVCLTALAHADAGSPVGTWKTISDETGKPGAIVEISEKDGVYSGRIVKLLEKSPDTVCDKCTDARKDQPVVGMVFLSGLKADGDQYTGGEILDPKNGKIYRARMKLIDGGARLEVRGFIGFALLGRTQTWLREP